MKAMEQHVINHPKVWMLAGNTYDPTYAGVNFQIDIPKINWEREIRLIVN